MIDHDFTGAIKDTAITLIDKIDNEFGEFFELSLWPGGLHMIEITDDAGSHFSRRRIRRNLQTFSNGIRGSIQRSVVHGAFLQAWQESFRWTSR